MFLIYDSKTAKNYEEGFVDCLEVTSDFVNKQLKKHTLLSYEDTMTVINNIILYFYHLKLLTTKGE